MVWCVVCSTCVAQLHSNQPLAALGRSCSSVWKAIPETSAGEEHYLAFIPLIDTYL